MATTATRGPTARSPRSTSGTWNAEETDRFLQHLEMNGRSPETVRAYRADLAGLMSWVNGKGQNPPSSSSTNFETLTARYLTEHRATWSPRTTGRKLGTFRAFARWAGDADFLVSYKAPTPGKPVPHPIPEGIDGVEAMLLAAGGDERYRALVCLTGLCGLRVGEALTIRPDDIDAQERLLKVRGKGDKTRTVPISDRAWAILEPCVWLTRKLFTGDTTLVQLRDRWARQIVKKLAKKAGISRDVASHDLRATLATAAFDRSKDLRAVQELLGHATSKTTETYTGVTLAGMREAVSL